MNMNDVLFTHLIKAHRETAQAMKTLLEAKVRGDWGDQVDILPVSDIFGYFELSSLAVALQHGSIHSLVFYAFNEKASPLNRGSVGIRFGIEGSEYLSPMRKRG